MLRRTRAPPTVDRAIVGRIRRGEFACLAAKILPPEQFGKAREDHSGGLAMIKQMMGAVPGGRDDSGAPALPTWEDTADSDEEQGDPDFKLGVMGQVVQMSGPMTDCAENVRDKILARRGERRASLVLDIRLVCILPEIRRRVRVPGNVPLAALHDKVIAPAFGWRRNYHAYLFTLGSWAYPNGNKLPEEHDVSFGPITSGAVDMMHSKGCRGGSNIVDATKVSASDLLEEPGQYLRYIYDLGDTWQHRVTLVEVREEYQEPPNTAGGSGRCPPEDSGGNYSHAKRLNELRTMGRCKDDRLPSSWDAEAFDVEAASQAVAEAWRTDLSAGDDANMFTAFPGTGVCGRNGDVNLLYERRRACAGCGAELKKCFLCSKCRNVAYCGAECQRGDWQWHKRICIRKQQ